MSGTTNTPTVPSVLSGVTVSAAETELKKARTAQATARKAANAKVEAARKALKEAREAAKNAPKATTARDVVREADKAILEFAGQLVELMADRKMAAEVAQLLSNQLHHLASPSAGWVGSLPTPARSEWQS